LKKKKTTKSTVEETSSNQGKIVLCERECCTWYLSTQTTKDIGNNCLFF